MKKNLLLLFILLNAQIICAQQYYDPYPITASQTYNGSQYRVECSVYDTSLATMYYYNSAYYDTIFLNPNLSSGIAAFASQTCALNKSYAGCITYDFEIHQWKTYLASQSVCDPSILMSWAGTSGNSVSLFIYTDNIYSRAITYEGYYDIIHHHFAIVSQMVWPQGMGYSTFNGLYAEFYCGSGCDEADFFISNYKNGSFNYLGGSAADPSCNFLINGNANWLTFHDYNSSCVYEFYANSFDAEVCIDCDIYYSHDANYISSNGMYLINDYQGMIHYEKYDAAYHKWESDSLPGTTINDWVAGQNVFALSNTVTNKVICGVYDFNQHCWIIDSVSTPSIIGLSINDGTVMWNNGSGIVSRGYDPLTGWGNYNTILTPIFYVSDVSQASGGNLILIRDYSIGATSYSVAFGDGKTGGTNDWHLYKKNGSYLYTGTPLQDTVCYTVTNSSGSVTSCIPVPCFKPTPQINASGTFLCPGDSVVLTSTTGLAYQWICNGIAIPNANAQNFYATVGGNYHCLVSDSCTAKYSNMLNIQAVSPFNGSVITTSSPTTFCSSSGFIQLSAIPVLPGTNYIWMRDSIYITSTTVPSINTIPPVSGNYYCILSNACNFDTSNTIAFNIIQAPSANISSGGINKICTGDSVKFSVTTGVGYTYQWKKNNSIIPGAIDSIFYATQAGNYKCVVSDTLCSQTSTGITLYLSSKPNVPITAGGPTTFCYPGNVKLQTIYNNSNLYQWSKNSISIPGANQYFYYASSQGSYKVNVSLQNSSGCDSTSLPIVVSVPCQQAPGGGGNSARLNGNSNNDADIYLFPNPTNCNLKLQILNGMEENISVTISDILGKKISGQQFKNTAGFNEHQLDVQQLIAGIYFVEVKLSGTTKILKLIKE